MSIKPYSAEELAHIRSVLAPHDDDLRPVDRRYLATIAELERELAEAKTELALARSYEHEANGLREQLTRSEARCEKLEKAAQAIIDDGWTDPGFNSLLAASLQARLLTLRAALATDGDEHG